VSLSPTQYQALWLRYAEDMELPKIAQVLGKSRVHVKVMLFRARQVLGREIRKAGSDAAGSSRHEVLNVRAGSALKSVSLLLL
jgi:DNA-directed RNA polymerase specialized sigma24 family protein